MSMKHGFLVVDKAQDWTSHDVVAKMRGVLQIKKIGHLGTLDPMATGVLVLAVGREATKQVQYYMGADKDYEVELELGKVSDSYDAEGEVEQTGVEIVEKGALTSAHILEVVEGFWGTSMQMPPAFSAKKVNGQRAYKLARQGKTVELKPKEVHMQGRDIEIDLPFVCFKVEVSSGTYIRSLVHDIGQTLGCGAIMTALRRTRVGDFTLDQAKSIDHIQAMEDPFELILCPEVR